MEIKDLFLSPDRNLLSLFVKRVVDGSTTKNERNTQQLLLSSTGTGLHRSSSGNDDSGRHVVVRRMRMHTVVCSASFTKDKAACAIMIVDIFQGRRREGLAH